MLRQLTRFYSTTNSTLTQKLPKSSDVVVVGQCYKSILKMVIKLFTYIEIGGGIIGLSTAYHLTELGYNNVVVIERDQITSGTTWHSNGKGILKNILRK